MALDAKRREVLKLMHGIVESYRTLSVSNVRGFSRLAKDYFDEEVDIKPTIAAVRSRRGDKIYAELKRLQSIVRGIEEKQK